MATAPTVRPTHRSLRALRQGANHPTPTLLPSVPLQRDTESPAARNSSGCNTSPTHLVGIARLAATSPLTEAKRGTEYFLLPVRSILNRCDSKDVPFTWTINPYRGCEFGCHYCYARYTHEFMELDGSEFERKIFVKKDAGPIAGRDLSREEVYGEHIAIGTATDPYQPAEREFKATRAILEQLALRRGLSVSITTKSDRVVDDLDLLQRIAEQSALSVNLSVTTLRSRLARALEPRAPRPDLRLAAVRRLGDAGVPAGVFAMPVLPGLTDSEADLDALACASRDAGAQWFGTRAVFLMSSSLKQFLPFLEKRFPRLVRQYRTWYSRGGYAPEKYRQELGERVRGLRRKYGLSSMPEVKDCEQPGKQLCLALGGARNRDATRVVCG
jgi:DNA repair photolyase